jgi:two-component system sensor histidine kinase KdpD
MQLRGILGNLLDAERVLGGHVQVRSQPSDLRALVVAALHAHGLGDSVLEPERGPVLVEIDAGLSARIIDNVVSNALRHTPAGTPIHVRLDRGADELTMRVADRGPGVPDDAKERVFEPFQRQGPSTGLGLGLFVVRRFAELQGGRAWVEDTEGGGATFCVTFASVDAAG